MAKDIYITGMGMISAQDSLYAESADGFSPGDDFHCIEPDYKEFIPPAKARRMSRILKFSFVAAQKALKESKVESPQTINVATALGCIKDTTLFLKDLIESKEEVLKPTPFINSTHNTVAGLLAISYGAKGQNFTFSHTSFSFEHALLDALMRMEENEIENAMVGAVEELTEETEIIKRHLRMQNQGEGASFFMLDTRKPENYYARVIAVGFAYEVENDADLNNSVMQFLKQQEIDPAEVDILVTNRDLSGIFDPQKQIVYPDYSGGYMTDAGFGFGMAVLEVKNHQKPVLMLNHNGQMSYSFMLLSK